MEEGNKDVQTRNTASTLRKRPNVKMEERKRREKLGKLFSSLRSEVPKLNSKSSKITVLNETMKYIQDLQETVQMLGGQVEPKAELNKEVVEEDILKQLGLEDEFKFTEEISEWLEKDLDSVEMIGRSIFQCTNQNSYVYLTVCNNMAIFQIRSVVQRITVSDVFKVFESHKANVLSANIVVSSTNIVVSDTEITIMVTAFVNGGEGDFETIKRDLMSLVV